jgi:hypothetical protein
MSQVIHRRMDDRCRAELLNEDKSLTETDALTPSPHLFNPEWAYVWGTVALLFGFAVGLGTSATVLWFGRPTLSPDKKSISSSASVTAAATTPYFP